MITCTALAIGLHIATYHFNRDAHYNETNPGIYANCNNYIVGTYYNSYSNRSSYVAYNFKHIVGPVDVMVGVVNGYATGNQLMIIPSVKFEHFRVSLIPAAASKGGGIHFTYEF